MKIEARTRLVLAAPEHDALKTFLADCPAPLKVLKRLDMTVFPGAVAVVLSFKAGKNTGHRVLVPWLKSMGYKVGQVTKSTTVLLSKSVGDNESYVAVDDDFGIITLSLFAESPKR